MKILITGGGIAGLAAALSLKRSGHDITVIDKAASFQKLGYGISLKGFGIELLEQLGLVKELRKYELPLSTLGNYRLDGTLIREFSKTTLDELTGGAIPVARADLHGVLYEAAKKVAIPIIFGTTIGSIDSLGSQEKVTFDTGKTASFDLVIVAEGLRSTTRKLLWKDEGWKPFDITYAAAIINHPHDFKPGQGYTYRGIGKTISFFPITTKQVAIQSYFRGISQSVKNREHTKTLLLQTFKEFPSNVVRLLEEISLDDFIFYDSVGMIDVPSLHKGHVVLLGDAGYCPTFLSGMGASLSLLGAKVLPELIQDPPSLDAALEQYDKVMKPIATHFQDNARSNMARELADSPRRLAINNWVMRVIPLWLLSKSVEKQLSVEKNLLLEKPENNTKKA